ncbi:MAG: hypothetical protein ACAH80_01450 [Alphaproteobacteria bacterium]
MDFTNIDIKDERSRVRRAFGNKLPQINGGNFITGPYTKGSGTIGMAVRTQSEWKNFWQITLGQEPPAPLPEGAVALMEATHHENDPVALHPRAIRRGNKGIDIDWNRIHKADPAEALPPSTFAVLLLPDDAIGTQIYTDVYPAQEKEAARQKLAEEVNAMGNGTKDRITLLPVTKLKKQP